MQYAIVTGASKGIGKAIATALASRGINLILVARSNDLLKNLSEELAQKYKVKTDFTALDLGQEDGPSQLLKWCTDKQYNVNILVNNAGYALWGRFEELPLEKQLNMMQLNMAAPLKLAYLFIPLLKKQPKSYILNIASTTAYQSISTLSVYAATKAFMVNFSRGLTLELRNSPISVTCFSPGTTDSEFMDNAGMEPLKKIAAKFSMKADVVAKTAVDAMFKSKTEAIPGFINRFSTFMTYFLPKPLIEKIAADIYEKNLPAAKKS
jgi:short-subunit dehydrogenase